jgi:hypothetical protein
LDVARALASHGAADQVHDPCAHERADEGDEWKEAELEITWLAFLSYFLRGRSLPFFELMEGLSLTT